MPRRRDSSAAPPSATSDGDEQSLSDLDYDVVSSASCGSLDSSLEMSRDMHGPPPEPPAAPAALARFAPATLGAADVQAHVIRALGASADAVQNLARRRPVRVYVDGAFDVFTAGHALHLRQAKLSFPSVRLVVGVFDDSSESVASYAPPLVERAELLRHCRWVDEVLSGAPDTIDTKFLAAHQIDYVAVEEGASLDPTFGKDRLRAYERLKELGKVIPTRRTFGLTPVKNVLSPGLPSLPLVDRPETPSAVASNGTAPPTPGPIPAPAISGSLAVEAGLGTPRSPLQNFEEGPPIDIFGIGI